MKLSLNWIKNYIAADISAEKLAHKMTMAGFEVEKIEKVKGDTLFEIEVTPNRSDCLNMLGLAREVSAILNKPLKTPAVKKRKYPSSPTAIQIENKKDCERYIGTIIKGVNIKSVPGHITKNLESLGNRAINNIVDITNFCLLETGQPLHAFDYDKLAGGKIIVRRAKRGEKIVTLDGAERELDPSILVIADAKKPVALAGIMGGANTEVSETTQNILLESAYFDPVLIRRAARKLGISTDSSYRFERGVDIDMVAGGAHRAIDLIGQNAGGVIVKHKDLFPGKNKSSRPSIAIKKEYLDCFLGTSIPLAKCVTILKKLGFQIIQGRGQSLRVTPPAFRTDVLLKEDVVEEIARIIGYDNLPSSMPHVQMDNVPSDPAKRLKDCLRTVLISQGLDEIITYTMVEQSVLDKTHLGDLKGIKIKNPLTQDQEMMNPAMLTRCLSVVQTNLNKGQKDFLFFEVGKIYTPRGEEEVLAILGTGLRSDDWRTTQKQQVDFYDLKGIVERTLSPAEVNTGFQKAQIFDKNCSVAIKAKTTPIGIMGKIASSILDKWDIKQQDIFYAQLSLAPVYALMDAKKKFVPIPEHPSIVRDISLAIKKDIPFETVRNIVCQNGTKLLSSVKFVEEYLGDQLPEDCRGITFSLTYQSPSRTLRDEEVAVIQDKIKQALTEKIGATLR